MWALVRRASTTVTEKSTQLLALSLTLPPVTLSAARSGSDKRSRRAGWDVGLDKEGFDFVLPKGTAPLRSA